MLEILQFYVSGFWIWLGITMGMGVVLKLFVYLVVGSIAAIRGSDVTFHDN